MTCYVKGDPERVYETLRDTYLNEVFIQVLPFGELPQMKDVRASNFCHIGVAGGPAERARNDRGHTGQPDQGVLGSGGAECESDAGRG